MENTIILKNILLNDNVILSIQENENIIFDIIPMLKYEYDFDQMSEWHCYDVWNHTIKAISLSPMDFELRLVLLLHDIGKPFSYQDIENKRHFKDHALKSKEISKPILEELGYKGNKLEELLFLIGEHATTINIENIDKNNIELYNKLIEVQMCDAGAYEPSHSQIVIKNLQEENNKIKELIKVKNKGYMI